MGASQSTVKSVTDIVQEATKDIVSTNSASCTAASSAQQSMTFRRIRAGLGCNVDFKNIGQKLKLEVNLNCVQNQANSADLQTKFDAAIDEKIKSESEAGLGLSKSQIDARKNIKQKIKSNIKMSSVASCLASTFGKQEIVVEDIQTADCVVPTIDIFGRPQMVKIADGISIKDMQQDLVIKTTAKCVQDQMNTIKDVADLKVKVVSDLSSTAKGADIVKIIMAAAALALICAVIYGLYLFGKPAAAMMSAASPPPGSAYNAPPPNYGGPPPGYGPPPNYGAPPQGYGPPPNYGAPPGYGYSQMNDLMPPSSVINAAKAFARKR